MARILISLIGAALLGCLAYGSKCPEEDSASRSVVCYYEGRTSLSSLNICNCTHLILTNAVKVTPGYTLDLLEDAKKDFETIRERKPSLIKIFTLNAKESSFLVSENKSRQILNEISTILSSTDLNGVELNLPLSAKDDVSKESVTSFVKSLKKKLENRVRVKRAGYDVSEHLQDDITTAPYRTPTARTSRGSEKYQTTKKSTVKRRKNYRNSRRRDGEDEEETERPKARAETRLRRTRKELRNDHGPSNSMVLVRLPVQPELIAKKFDLKALSKYADLLVMSTHNITDESEEQLTYHPSRLMGLSDMLNADSILDFLTGLGVEKSKIVMTLPATIFKFQLKDSKKTTPRSPTLGGPQTIDQKQLCSLFSKGNWTVERDDDLTAPYAFYDKTWLAYEDKISVNIKAKYILLRELAGGAVYPMDSDTGRDPCNDTSIETGYLINTLYSNFRSLARKPRGLVLESLQQDIHNTAYSTLDASVHQSEYRIVRVVDHSGAVHVIRKNTKTQFECSRQGYFSHPLGCNKFYRCVKFNQYTDDYTVFEYDCPAGLAFDERWEVCVWPGSLPHGAPCTGSSEIAPVPRSHYQCPNQEGYYADPENCRWFFACLDHARDGVTPLTAYEFRCPFGLVFNEHNLACDWPWNVGSCGNRGFSGVIVEHHGGSSSLLQSASFSGQGSINSGHQEGSFASSGQSNSGFFAQGAGGYSSSGYISSHFDDNQDRASFATVPDYEISGGRILNQGGLVLNQNLVGFNKQANNFGFNQGTYDSGHVSGFAQTVAPAPAVTKLDQLVYDPPLSSPRPFSARIPEVQVSQGEHSYVGGVTTPRVENFAYAGGVKSDTSGTFKSFSASSQSNENLFVHGNAGFGHKVASEGHIDSGRKQFEFHVSTPAPAYPTAAEGISSGIQQVSHFSASSSGSVSDNSKVLQNVHFSSAGNNYRIPSTTPQPNVFLQQNLGVTVTPRPHINLYHQTGNSEKTTGQFNFGVAYGASNNSQAFIHRPLVEVSTAVPYKVEFSPSSEKSISSFSGNGFQSFGSKSAGNAILLEEHVERVVIPRVLPTFTPSISHQQPSISLKPVLSSTPKPYSSATPGTTLVTVERQEFIGPIEISSPAPNYRQEKIHTVVSTPAPTVFKSEQQNFNQFRRPAQSEYPNPIPAVFTKQEYASGSFGGNVNGGVTIHNQVQTPVVQEVKVNQPAVGVYRGPEYLPPVQQNIYSFNRPSIQTKFETSSVYTPAPVFRRPEHVSSGVTVLKPQVHSVSTPVPVYTGPQYSSNRVTSQQGFIQDKFKVVKPAIQQVNVVSPAPNVYKAPEYLPPVRTGTISTVQLNNKFIKTPVVQTQFVSTPAPIVYKQPEYVAVEQGNVQLKTVQQNVQNVQTYFSAPEVNFVQQTVSTPAPSVFKAPEYLPPVSVKINQDGPQTKFIQSVVSTPAPAIFKQQENVQFKTIQQNIQTFSPSPDVKFVQPVISTPAPSVYKAPEYLPPVRTGTISTVQLNHKFIETPVAQTQFVSTPAPTVYKKPEYVAVEQGNVQLKTVQQNIQTFSPAPDVKFVQPVVSTPAPNVYKAPEYLPPEKTETGTISAVQNHEFLKTPIVRTQFVSTPAPTIYKKPEYVAVEQGRTQLKTLQQNVQNVQTYFSAPEVNVVQQSVSTPAPSVFKAPEYLPPVRTGTISTVQLNHKFIETPVAQTQFVSTPAPTVYKKPEYVAVEQGNVQLKTVQQNIQTFSPAPEVKFVQPVVSTPAPNVYKAPEYLPPEQTETGTISAVQNHEFLKTPIVRTQFVSTPAPTIYKKPEYVAVEQGRTQLKTLQQNVQNVQTYFSAPEVNVVQQSVSTPAPSVFKAPEYLPPVRTGTISTVQLNHKFIETPVAQTQFVSTPAPTVYKKPEYVAVEQGNVQLKTVQQNIQTFSPAPDVKFVQPVVSTPAPNVYKAPEYLPPEQTETGTISAVQNHEFLKTPIVRTQFVSTPAPTIYKKPEYVAVEQGRTQLKTLQQNVQNVQTYFSAPEVNVVQQSVSTPAPSVFKAAEYLPPVSVKVADNRPLIEPVSSTPATTVFITPKYTSGVVEEKRTGSVTVLQSGVQDVQEVTPSIYKGPEYLPPVSDQRAELKSIRIDTQTPEVILNQVVSTASPSVVSVKEPASFNFVSTTFSPVTYEDKEIPETVSFPPVNYQQETYRNRGRGKQFFQTVPQVSVQYQQSRPEDYLFGLKSLSQSQKQILSYQTTPAPSIEVSTSKIIDVPVTSKSAVVIEEEKVSVPVVTQNTIELEHSTAKPFVYEEYVSVASPKPEQPQGRLQHPIIVTESPKQDIIQQVVLQPEKKQPKIVYYENYEKNNPIVTALGKEVVQQQTYTVSSESPVVLNNAEGDIDYYPPTGEEIENYSNFEFQKIGKAKSSVFVQDSGVYNGGIQSQAYEVGNEQQVNYKINKNIEIPPPPEEYLVDALPKVVTTTIAPLTTTTVYRTRARPTTSTEKYYNENYETNSERSKATVFSVGQVDDEELDNGSVESLLEKYSGEFGNVVGRDKFVTKVVEGEERGEFVVGNDQEQSTVGYEVSTSRTRGRGRSKSAYVADKTDDKTVASLDLKNLKLKKNKKTVIIVSQVSDANPLLIGKLAGQCSCQSNKIQIKKKITRIRGRPTTTTTTTTTTTYAPLLEESDIQNEGVLDSLAIENITPKTSSENVIFIDGSRKSNEQKTGRALFTPEELSNRPAGKGRVGEFTGNDLGQALFTPVSAAEIAKTGDYAGKSSVAVGDAFDRYGPGGLRSFDETLQGSVDCERPGLFRHPKYCNKFYSCNYDPKKKKYTLHVFNCPIHLSYDSSISACNWPSKGPACSDDHLLL